jgi:hypothetical protein
MKHRATLERAFAERYPEERHRTLRERMAYVCCDHLAKGLGDRNAEKRLCSPNDDTFWQQFSEVLLADQLAKAGLRLSHRSEGPDFLIEHGGRRIWIEVICPTATGIPDEWLRRPHELGFEVYSLPHEAILLRWTAAIKEKAEKLIGTPGYLAKRVVDANDAYVIAVNGRLLRATGPQIEGISQWPFAVEATLSVGPYAVTIDRGSIKAIGSGHQHRPLIPKSKGARVPADTFFDLRFAPISAIWAADIDESLLMGQPRPMVAVHNPNALNRVPLGVLPAHAEYVAIDEGDAYRVTRHSGKLHGHGAA